MKGEYYPVDSSSSSEGVGGGLSIASFLIG